MLRVPRTKERLEDPAAMAVQWLYAIAAGLSDAGLEADGQGDTAASDAQCELAECCFKTRA